MKIEKMKIKLPKVKHRKVTPAHAMTKIERDKSNYTRKEKYSYINTIRDEEDI